MPNKFNKNKTAFSTLKLIVFILALTAAGWLFQVYSADGGSAFKEFLNKYFPSLQNSQSAEEKCSWSEKYSIAYSPSQYITKFDEHVKECVNSCSSSNRFDPCRNDPPGVCCYTSGDASFCAPNCCYNECRVRCDEIAVLAGSDACKNSGTK